jgi:hypothetical protein
VSCADHDVGRREQATAGGTSWARSAWGVSGEKGTGASCVVSGLVLLLSACLDTPTGASRRAKPEGAQEIDERWSTSLAAWAWAFRSLRLIGRAEVTRIPPLRAMKTTDEDRPALVQPSTLPRRFGQSSGLRHRRPGERANSKSLEWSSA